MANTKSAEKQNRKRVKQRARNVLHLSKMRTQVKKATSALEENNWSSAKDGPVIQSAIRQLARSAQKGVIKKGTASRKISRLVRAMNQKQAVAAH